MYSYLLKLYDTKLVLTVVLSLLLFLKLTSTAERIELLLSVSLSQLTHFVTSLCHFTHFSVSLRFPTSALMCRRFCDCAVCGPLCCRCQTSSLKMPAALLMPPMPQPSTSSNTVRVQGQSNSSFWCIQSPSFHPFSTSLLRVFFF